MSSNERLNTLHFGNWCLKPVERVIMGKQWEAKHKRCPSISFLDKETDEILCSTCGAYTTNPALVFMFLLLKTYNAEVWEAAHRNDASFLSFAEYMREQHRRYGIDLWEDNE
jgi:hypothetical protein